MTDVKLPEPVIMGMTEINFSEFESAYGYTEAQLKQYGDDRALEALEMAAKVCVSLAVTACNDSNITRHECADAIRALAKEIK